MYVCVHGYGSLLFAGGSMWLPVLCWGRLQLEAMAMRLPVITTNW
jgi:hypothetical protein